MLVGKQTSEALLLAENAARGNFPSYQHNLSELKFDYYLVGYFYQPAMFYNTENYALEEEKIAAYIRERENKYNLKRRIVESKEFKSSQSKKKETRKLFRSL
jgi:hypothetical protein